MVIRLEWYGNIVNLASDALCAKLLHHLPPGQAEGVKVKERDTEMPACFIKCMAGN